MSNTLNAAGKGSTGVRRLFEGSPVLCDGAMGTMLYARGVFINRCYDELNLTQPEMVRAIHQEYLQAGAEVIETNTFGANAYRLEHYGLRDKVWAINAAGVKLAIVRRFLVIGRECMGSACRSARFPLGEWREDRLPDLAGIDRPRPAL